MLAGGFNLIYDMLACKKTIKCCCHALCCESAWVLDQLDSGNLKWPPTDEKNEKIVGFFLEGCLFW
jgi:hypothetical protein